MPRAEFLSRELGRFGTARTQYGTAKHAADFDRDYLE